MNRSGKIFVYVLFLSAVCLLFGADPVLAADTQTLHGKYSVTVGSYDWGPAACGVLLTLDEPVDCVTAESISVSEVLGGGEAVPRVVQSAVLSDGSGTAVDVPSDCIYLELAADPSVGSLLTGEMNRIWDPKYEIRFTLNAPLKGGGTVYDTLEIDPKFWGWDMPQSDRFLHRAYTSYRYDVQYRYAAYLPDRDDHLNPLIIWLHGGGEGGRDSTAAVMGNRVCALTEDPIQCKMGGAYILVPQCPTYWMDGYSPVNGGESVYTRSLMELIRWYVKKHPDIDPHRIYIGGLSNGGYMTLEMLKTYPSYFAAGFPICSGYAADTLEEKDIRSLAQIPLWFVYAETDSTVDPEYYSAAVIRKLQQAGSDDLHVTSPEYVDDPTGQFFSEDGVTPYRYDGHTSWIYVLNSAAYDDAAPALELFTWLSGQKLEKLPANPLLKWILPAAVVLLLCISVGCFCLVRKGRTARRRNLN